MKYQQFFIVLLTAILVSACGGGAPSPSAQAPEALPPEIPPAEGQVVSGQTEGEAPQPEAEQEKSSNEMIAYTAPQGLFSLNVPASWLMEKDNQTLENTVIETFEAPNDDAFIQIVVNEVGKEMDKVLKGQVTLDYMKRLYNTDLRVSSDVTLDDGREKLEWWSEKGNMSGTTFFDTCENYLFLFTISMKDESEEKYEQILQKVTNSFNYS